MKMWNNLKGSEKSVWQGGNASQRETKRETYYKIIERVRKKVETCGKCGNLLKSVEKMKNVENVEKNSGNMSKTGWKSN